METDTKVKFFLIVGCVIFAAILPTVAFAAFGVIGGLILCGYVIFGIISLLTE